MTYVHDISFKSVSNHLILLSAFVSNISVPGEGKCALCSPLLNGIVWNSNFLKGTTICVYSYTHTIASAQVYSTILYKQANMAFFLASNLVSCPTSIHKAKPTRWSPLPALSADGEGWWGAECYSAVVGRSCSTWTPVSLAYEMSSECSALRWLISRARGEPAPPIALFRNHNLLHQRPISQDIW